MKNEVLKDYLINGKIDIDKILDDFYGYVYIIVKNAVSISITNEDIEEIISDVFLAIWKNSKNLSDTVVLKPYLTGTAKNVIKNKYRMTELNFPISEYEEILADSSNLQEISEENEQNNIIKDTLKLLKQEDYNIFIMFYYESRTIKEISKILNCSESKIKVILHRVRRAIKKNLEDGGYGYGK
ncbi:MAG: sigma-70 family RNA polymerase sigma factor [Clostridia bacterium]|nr:sigma-70 family RNA polymerase sigma factor [Clostridia bacterium]